MRRFLKWTGLSLLLIVLVGSAGATWWYFDILDDLAAHRTQTEHLRKQAALENQEAEAMLRQGTFDLEIAVSSDFLLRMVKALEGLEITNKRGARFVVNEAKPTLTDGAVMLEAEADFHARFGLYNGPVHAVYAAFTSLQEDGSCRLDFRIIDAGPKDPPPFWNEAFEAWLILRLQRKMKIPDFELPIKPTIPQISLPEINKHIEAKNLDVRVPARQVDLSISRPLLLLDERGLKAAVGRIIVGQGDDAPGDNDHSAPREPLLASNTDISIRLHFHVLREAIQALTKPEEEVLLHSDFMPKVYEKEKKLLGLKTVNYADLRDVDGSLNIIKADLQPRADGLVLDLQAEGKITGTADGKFYGIKTKLPFEAVPILAKEVPVEIVADEEGTLLRLEPTIFEPLVHFKFEVAGQTIRFKHTFELEPEALFQPFHISHWVTREIKLPRKVHRKKVTESQSVPVTLNWSPRLPEDDRGYLELSGAVEIKAAEGLPDEDGQELKP